MQGKLKTPVLALDIGNTRAHIGIVDTERHTCIASVAFPVGEIGLRLSPAVEALIGSTGVSVGKTVAIAGVVQNAVSAAEKLLLRDGFVVNQLTSAAALPLALRYDTPHTLGTDRVANALYAITVHPGKSVVCVSVGTAIVVDYVADNTFFGGAILPGIKLQLASLHQGTDALPDCGSAASIEIPSLPGASTEQCIIGGVVRGVAAAICGIVAGYGDQQQDRRPHVISTGGDWPLVAPLVNFDYTAVPDQTLIGIARSLCCI